MANNYVRFSVQFYLIEELLKIILNHVYLTLTEFFQTNKEPEHEFPAIKQYLYGVFGKEVSERCF